LCSPQRGSGAVWNSPLIGLAKDSKCREVGKIGSR